MRKLFFILFFAFAVSFFAADLGKIDNLDLMLSSDWDKLTSYISEDPGLLPLIGSRIRIDIPQENLSKYIIILGHFRYKNSFFPVKIVFETILSERIKASCITYFLSIFDRDSIAILKKYLIDGEKFNQVHYIILEKLLRERKTIDKFFDALYTEKGDKNLNAILAASYPIIFKERLVNNFINGTGDIENVAYSLFYITHFLDKKDIVEIYKKIKNDSSKLFYFIPIIEKNGEKAGFKILKSLKISKDENLKKLAMAKIDEIKKVLEVPWIKDKIQTADIPHEDFQNLFNDLIKDPYTNYDIQRIVKLSSSNEINKLKDLNVHIAKSMNPNDLIKIDRINNLIFILKIANFYSYIVGL
jgi:ribosomal protein S13